MTVLSREVSSPAVKLQQTVLFRGAPRWHTRLRAGGRPSCWGYKLHPGQNREQGKVVNKVVGEFCFAVD